jgi:hypothetical protein
MQVRIDSLCPSILGKSAYYGGNVAERAAVGNVTDTTTNEQLLLRQPLGRKTCTARIFAMMPPIVILLSDAAWGG